jgi:hypothetical protein
MTDRIDRYLAGTLGDTTLTPEERRQADAIERVVRETRAFVDRQPAPDLTRAVMHRIAHGERAAAHRLRGVLGRLAASVWTPRDVSFQVRPVYGLVAVGVVVAVAIVAPDRQASTDAAPTAPASPAPTLFVQFRLEAEASSVRLAGSFTDWQPTHVLHESAPGHWTITLPLPAGVHDYAFVVDGQQWVPDPYAPAVDDGFGGANSRMALLPPETPRS